MDWWRSREPIATPYKIIETLMPRYVVSMFASPDWLKVEAQTPESEDYELMVESLLKKVVQEMNLFPKLKEALRYATIMGHAWGKVLWREEYEFQRRLTPQVAETQDEMGQILSQEGQVGETVEQVEVYNGPDFSWVTLDKVFPDPTGKGDWYIEDIETNMDELLDAQDSSGGELYDQSELDRLAVHNSYKYSDLPGNMTPYQEGTGSSMASYDYAKQPESTEGIPNWEVSPFRDGTGVRLWQCWGKVPRKYRDTGKLDGDEKTLDAWRLCVIAEGQFVLRNVPAPTPNGKPPYFPIKSIPIPDRLYGESILNYVGPLADQQTRLANMRIDEVFLNIFKQYMIAQNKVLSSNQDLITPGGFVQLQLEPGQSVNDVFGVVPNKPVITDAYTEDSYRQTQAEHISGATDIMQGVGEGGRTTATEVERKLQQGNARHVLQTMWYDYTVKKELLTRSWKWLQMRMTNSKSVRINDQQTMNIDASHLTIPADIIVSGGIFEFSRGQRMEVVQQLTQMSQSPIFGPVMKPIPIVKYALDQAGLKNTERFVLSEDEFAKQQQQQQIQQILQGAGGQGGGQGQPAGPLPPLSGAGGDASMVGGLLGGAAPTSASV